jgi:hypothetical protein
MHPDKQFPAKKLIIALVPTKTEEHIIEAFIKATLLVADKIIIADQKSQDATRALARRNPHVHVINNNSEEFNEPDRQQLLIAKARELYGLGNVLLAIDADEFFFPLDGNPFSTREAMLTADAGTTFLFDKPTLVDGDRAWITYGPVFPLGYVDDGVSHTGSYIHSRRVPGRDDRSQHVTTCAFLHLDYYDIQSHLAKRRYYSCLERIRGHKNLTRWRQNSRLFIRQHLKLKAPASSEWRSWLELQGIDIKVLRRRQPYWWETEMITLMSKYGCELFWWDDIWYIPYRPIIEDAIQRHAVDACFSLKMPPLHITVLRTIAIFISYCLLSFKSAFRRSITSFQHFIHIS